MLYRVSFIDRKDNDRKVDGVFETPNTITPDNVNQWLADNFKDYKILTVELV